MSAPSPSLSTASSPASKEKGARAEAEACIERFYDALRTGEVAAVDRAVVPDADAVYFGTDQSERWVGNEALLESVRQQFAAFKTTNLGTRDRVVHVSGDVAWFSEILDWTLQAGDQEMKLENLRLTGVVVRRDGDWRTAQFHLSKGVDGQAVEY